MPPSFAENQEAVAAVPERLSADDPRRVSATVEWQDFRKPPRLKKPLPSPAERVCTEAELKLIHVRACRRLLECVKTRPTSCSNYKSITSA